MNGTLEQFDERPARQAAHSPQEIWNGTLTSWPGTERPTASPSSTTLRDALVAERERWRERRLAGDDQRVEIAGRDRHRSHQRGRVRRQARLRRLTPLEPSWGGVEQLLHAASLPSLSVDRSI